MGARDGLTTVLEIKGERGDKEARLLLIDTPGELETQSGDEQVTDYEWHMSRVDRCDGIVYMIDGSKETEIDGEWLSNLMTYSKGRIPVAVTMTKSDKLRDRCSSSPLMVRGRPVITGGYFERQKKLAEAGYYREGEENDPGQEHYPKYPPGSSQRDQREQKRRGLLPYLLGNKVGRTEE